MGVPRGESWPGAAGKLATLIEGGTTRGATCMPPDGPRGDTGTAVGAAAALLDEGGGARVSAAVVAERTRMSEAAGFCDCMIA